MSTTTTLFGAAEAQAARTLVGGTTLGDTRNELLKQILVATANRTGGSSSVAFADITGAPGDNSALAAALALKLDKAGGTMTGALVNSANGAASVPALHATGAVLTGQTSTTNKPHWLIEPTGTTSNNWSTNGTLFGGNAPSGFTGNVFDFQLNGLSGIRGFVNASGNAKIHLGLRGANIDTTPDYQIQINGYFGSALLQDSAGNTSIGSTYSIKTGSNTIGFYGVTPITRAVLATGAGASVDNVITALQNLGLVKQA